MGWNDRLPEDPYTPPSSYYTDQAEYEAWHEYVVTQLKETRGSFTSQNLDPGAAFTGETQEESPGRQTILSRLWARISGQKIPKKQQESDSPSKGEDASLPF